MLEAYFFEKTSVELHLFPAAAKVAVVKWSKVRNTPGGPIFLASLRFGDLSPLSQLVSISVKCNERGRRGDNISV